ncbi:MAG: hypothetical protein J5791_06940 [Fibrobacter sp.]|nr:hypothetical protein [Fibrobacter sp.]
MDKVFDNFSKHVFLFWEYLTKIGVVLFTLVNVFFLSMCSRSEYSEGLPHTLLKSRTAEGQLSSCEIEGKKIYHYKKPKKIDGLQYYYRGDRDVRDEWGLAYKDGSGYHPLISVLVPFQQLPGLEFFIFDKPNEYIVFYYLNNEDGRIDSIRVDEQPFSKEVVLKKLNPSDLKESYVKNATCFVDRGQR